MNFLHKPVLLKEAVEGIFNGDGAYLDATIGGGGHTAALLEKLGSNSKVFGIDRDADAIAACQERFANESRVKLIRGRYENVSNLLNENFKGALLDLGVSSPQLDIAERGFSYKQDGPLDMRMDTTAKLTAADILNNFSKSELTSIFRSCGELSDARRIATAVRRARPLSSTKDLAQIAERFAYQKNVQAKIFQAIRITVNGELEGLGAAIEDIIKILESGGVVAVITFHSLEDRIVKQKFAELENPCICPREAPYCVCGRLPVLKRVNKKAIIPSKTEVAENSRAASAKLRVARKI